MKFLNNRKVAGAILVVCILGSILGLGGGSLVRERSSVMRVYEEGSDPSLAVRFSIDAYMENCADYARTMAEEYRLHVDADGKSAAVVLSLAEEVADGENTEIRADSYRNLCSAVESLYTDFHAAKVTEADQSVFSKAYTNFQSEVNKVGYDEYNGRARLFNQKLDAFPASLVSGLLGVDELEIY